MTPKPPSPAPAELAATAGFDTCAAFVYGTLQVPAVLERVLGRVPPLRPAELRHYRRGHVSRQRYPAVVPSPNDCVTGSVLSELRETDWQSLDAYEGSLYARQAVVVTVDGLAWTVQSYVLRPEHAHLFDEQPWSLERFVERDLLAFLAELDDDYPTE
jgi:gamma-glutamylcyclotransferase (GGCT)/AIG2-like uncharacterized protein YtfP